MLEQLVMKLDEHNLTNDFLSSIRKMASGELPVDSIPHLAYLDSVCFKRIKDSQRMLYKPKMKCFWHCLYKVAGGPALRLLSGPRGTGENNYDTSLANINFTIPSQSTLQRISKSSHNSMPPSIFNPVLETISASVQDSPKEFILSFDGKSVGTGLKGDCEGDIDLWNFESKPNLQEEKDRLSDEQDFVNEIRRSVKEHNLSGIKDNLYKLIKIVTFSY